LKKLLVSLRWPSYLLGLGALVVAVVAFYSLSLGSALVFDDSLLASGQIFAEYGSFSQLKTRWLSYGSFAWLQRAVPDAWWLQRLFNVLLHVAVVLMLYSFYDLLLRGLHLFGETPDAPGASTVSPRWALLVGVAWFALNPTAVYAVAYLIQRSILMATLFSLVSLWAVLQALVTARRRYWALAVLAYLAAMLSKEYALMLPAVAFALVVIVVRPPARRLVGFALVGLLVAAAVAYPLYQRFSSILGTPFDEVSVAFVGQMDAVAPGVGKLAYPLSIVNQMWLFFEYGCRWFLPTTTMMAVDLRPPFPIKLTSVPHLLGVVGYLSLLAASVVLMLRYRGRMALLGFCLFAPAILFFTEFSSVWIQDPFVLYRSYLWAIALPGVIFLLASAVSTRALAAVSVVVVAIFAWQTIDRIGTFRSELSVWNDAVQKLPPELVLGKSRAYLNRGQAYQAMGQDTRALRDYQRSTVFGDGGEGLLNTGTLLLAAGRSQEALQAFEGAKARGLSGVTLALNRGTALAALGQTQAAYESFSSGLTQGPSAQELAALRRQRASAALLLGRADEALADALAAIAVFGNDPQIRVTQGYALWAKGQRDAAIVAFNDSLAQAANAPAYFGLARLHADAGRAADARAAIAKALALRPENVEFQRFSAKLGAGS
jgi:protein O-mannosyl-transferase